MKQPEELDFKNIDEKLMFIQTTLKVEKGNVNNFAKFNYRTLSDIYSKVKPLLEQTNCSLRITDDLIEANGNNYIKATATLSDGEDSVESVGIARESLNKKGMDDPQMTGTASTYARKYACNGLLAIDDTPDPDSMDNREELHHNGKPVKENCVTQDQSIKMDRLARDVKTLPFDKSRLKKVAQDGYIISALEAQTLIEDAKAGQIKQVGKKVIADLTKRLAEADKQTTIDYLDANGWTSELVKKAEEKLKENK
jgi:hypothetical protein|tara:strand:+ start:2486 stop:3247 length:762 start_codon:yes stop_codon:yes gene_type:complete